MDTFIGEIRAFPYSFVPLHWLPCDGRSLQQQAYAPLHAVIGQNFGGSGTSFNLPNLTGRAPIGMGQGPGLTAYTIGNTQGEETVQFASLSQMPLHTHTLSTLIMGYAKSPTSFKASPTANTSWLSRYTDITAPTTPVTYSTYNPLTSPTPPPPTNPVAMNPGMMGPDVGALNTPHSNMQPYLAFRFCICAEEGIFPVRAGS